MIIRTRQRRRPREKFQRRVPRYWSDFREYRRRMVDRQKAVTQKEAGQVAVDMPRTFTLSEAETLLPVLESLLRSAMQAKSLIEEQHAKITRLMVELSAYNAKTSARRRSSGPRTRSPKSTLLESK